ncbi:MAG TPA: pyridoxal-dependent decarboxylase [Kofleriaceae bacterium]|nr:pyridoxal-dependent decarboxylase [Kofleriaceae bacterium]
MEPDKLLADTLAMAEDYLGGLGRRRVFPAPEALAALERFDEPLPEGPGAPLDTIRLLHRIGAPATTASAGGRFFGLVVGGALPVALAASWLTAAWDQVVFNDATSPVGVKLEQVASRWLLAVLGLPDGCSVGFVTGATMGNFLCLAAARDELLRRQGHDVQALGMAGAPPLRVVTSDQIHVTVIKALTMLGFGTRQIERVATDDQGRIVADALPPLDERCIVIAQAGNVNSGASDPFRAIWERASPVGAWMHVDGAFGLWAAAAPERAAQLDGVALMDSWATDAHKWLNTPYDCGIAVCRHPEAVHRAMATQAPYLKQGGTAAPKDMVPEFSRRARGIEVWAALRSLGRQGVANLIEACCRHAQRLGEGLEAIGFRVLNRVVLNQVVATIGTPEQIAEITRRVQASGACWFGTTSWRGQAALRLSVSSWATTGDDIEQTLAAIERATREVLVG